jgi:hypothetical protein
VYTTHTINIRLGRARAVRTLGMAASPSQATQASKDYEMYFGYISRVDDEEDDNDVTNNKKGEGSTNVVSAAIVDGIQRNPYAAWEWGMVQRVAGQYDNAAEVHKLAANAFKEIGDQPRSIICHLDEGLDLAAGLDEGSKSGEVAKTKKTLEEAIDGTVGVDGRDVELLQRVVAKEGEARIALSGVMWGSKEKAGAESQFGEACGKQCVAFCALCVHDSS